MRRYTKRRRYNTKRKPWRRYKGKVSKKQWKASKKAAKSVIYRMSETQRIHYNGSVQGIATGATHNITGFNPFALFYAAGASGSAPNTQSAFRGNEIDMRYVEFRWHLFHTSNTSAIVAPVYLQFTLIRTSQTYALQAGTPYVPEANIGSISWVTTTGDVTLRKWNSNAVRVLSQKRYKLPGGNYGAAVATVDKIGKTKFRKLKGKKTFETSYNQTVSPTTSAGDIKGGNYYIIIQLYSPMSSVAGSGNTVSLNYDVSLYFKDV